MNTDVFKSSAIYTVVYISLQIKVRVSIPNSPSAWSISVEMSSIPLDFTSLIAFNAFSTSDLRKYIANMFYTAKGTFNTWL